MKHLTRTLGLLTATMLLASCGIFGDKDEELEPKELVDFDSTIKVKRLWTSKIGGKSDYLLVGLQPQSDGNRVYAASQDGKVAALDPATGKAAWKVDIDAEISAGPAANEGGVAVATKDGYLVLLDAADGSEQWRAFVGGETLAHPLIKDDAVIVQTIDNRLQSFSRFDGRQRWAIEQSMPALTMRGATSPLLVDSYVVAGFDNGRVLAVQVETGDIEWDSFLAIPTGRSDLERLSDIDGALAVVGQDLYAAGYQGRIAAIASESGQVLWQREISSYTGVAADWNNIYTSRDDGEVIALTRSSGQEVWRNDDLLRRDPTLPVPFGQTVVVGDFEGYVHFFSTFTGEIAARVRLGKSAISHNPVVFGNRVYVQSDDGTVGCYEIVQDRPQRTAPDVADES